MDKTSKSRTSKLGVVYESSRVFTAGPLFRGQGMCCVDVGPRFRTRLRCAPIGGRSVVSGASSLSLPP